MQTNVISKYLITQEPGEIVQYFGNLPISLSMKARDLPQEVLDGAYKIFIQEIADHMSNTQFVLLETELSNHPLFGDATRRFHKIRGGAGFFGLNDIEQTAKELELLFKNMPKAKAENLDTVRRLYVHLSDLVETSLSKRD